MEESPSKRMRDSGSNILKLARGGGDSSDASEGYAIKILVGNSNRKLGDDIASALKVPLAVCEVGAFSDGETKIHIENNIRGTDCYVIQPTCHNSENGTSVNDNLMELYVNDFITRPSNSYLDCCYSTH